MIKQMVLSPVRLGVDGFIYGRFAWACLGEAYSGLGSSVPWAGLGRVRICSPPGGPGWAVSKSTSTSNLALDRGFARLARAGLHEGTLIYIEDGACDRRIHRRWRDV